MAESVGAAVGKQISLEVSLGHGQWLEVLMSVSELSWNKHVFVGRTGSSTTGSLY